LNLWKSFTIPETRVFRAANRENLAILACTIFYWSTCVMDRQTELWWLKPVTMLLPMTSQWCF